MNSEGRSKRLAVLFFERLLSLARVASRWAEGLGLFPEEAASDATLIKANGPVGQLKWKF
jgi:hypothetical protein